MKKEKRNPLLKGNKCPYCLYKCDAATMIKGEDKPHPGCISFCLMCCEPSTWDENMRLIKFDLNSIPDLMERNRIKILGMRVAEFWEKNPDSDGRRLKHLKIMDRRCK